MLESNDANVDKDLGFTHVLKVGLQCKDLNKAAGVAIARDLEASLKQLKNDGRKNCHVLGILVSSAGFTQYAVKYFNNR